MNVDEPSKRAAACIALLDSGKLAEAFAYRSEQRTDPPQYSFTAESPNAHDLGMKAMDQLSDKA